VASNVGGIPEIVRDNETGFLVPPNNADALANSIITLIQNKDLREIMGQKGKLLINERFSPEKIVIEHINVYQRAINLNKVNIITASISDSINVAVN
jgi:glycosyltransferase involved in cell wall biosynthesis